MQGLVAALEELGEPIRCEEDGVEEQIKQLSLRFPDNIHLSTFDKKHYMGMSEDEQQVYCWCKYLSATPVNIRWDWIRNSVLLVPRPGHRLSRPEESRSRR